MFQIREIQMPDGGGPQRPDRLMMCSALALTIAAQANLVTALGSITAGTAFTQLPTIAPTGGTLVAGGKPSVVRATSLKVVGTPTVVAGGTGYVTADTVTFANGVVLAVTASGGIVSALSVTTAGAFKGPGAVPTNPVAPISTSGVGVGLTANLVWGLGTASIDDSGNYSGAPSWTVTPVDGNGTGASIATGTLGGAGATAFIQVGPFTDGIGVPGVTGAPGATVFGLIGIPDQDAVCYDAGHTPTYGVIGITPRLAANSLVAGTVRALIWA